MFKHTVKKKLLKLLRTLYSLFTIAYKTIFATHMQASFVTIISKIQSVMSKMCYGTSFKQQVREEMNNNINKMEKGPLGLSYYLEIVWVLGTQNFKSIMTKLLIKYHSYKSDFLANVLKKSFVNNELFLS